MMTIKPVRAMRDIEIEDSEGGVFRLVEGRQYELHMGDAKLVTRPDRFYPCEIHLLGESEVIGIIDQREAGTLIADGSLT